MTLLNKARQNIDHRSQHYSLEVEGVSAVKFTAKLGKAVGEFPLLAGEAGCDSYVYSNVVGASALTRANLRRYRASVLKSAVEGRLTQKWRVKNPGVEPASELLARILRERRQRWEQQQLATHESKGKNPPKNLQSRYKEPAAPNLPELPEGWCWATIEHRLTENSCNGIFVKGSDTPSGVPALKLNALQGKGFNYQDRRYIPITDAVAERLAIEAGNFFVSRGNGTLRLVGRSSLAQQPPERIVLPDRMIRLRFAESENLRQYLELAWDSRLARNQIERAAKTTAGIYKISQRDIGRFVLPMPPIAEQFAIVEELESSKSLADSTDGFANSNIKRSLRLRQSILKSAFEGQLLHSV